MMDVQDTEVVTSGYGLTNEVLSKLAAPVPASEISTKNQGGSAISFTSDKFVMHRLNEVVGVGGWQDHYTSTPHAPVVIHEGKKSESLVTGQIVCHLTVLGVTKSGVADMEVPQGYDIYGTPATNAQARAFKRAAMKFGIAAELWDKDITPASEDRPSSQPSNRQSQSQYQSKPAAQSNRGGASNARGGKSGGLTEPQIAWLTTGKDDKPGLHVPMAVVEKLEGGRGNSGSQLLDALFSIRPQHRDYNSNPLPYIEEALAQIGRDDLIDLLYGDDVDKD